MKYDVQIYIDGACIPQRGRVNCFPRSVCTYIFAVIYSLLKSNKKHYEFRISVNETCGDPLLKEGTLTFGDMFEIENNRNNCPF